MNSLRLLILSALTVSFLTACSNDDKTDKKEGKISSQIQTQMESRQSILKIVGTDGASLAGAQILIGSSGGQSDLITAGADGSFEAPAAWTDKMPVTISAPGYVRVTYLAQIPHGQTFMVRKQEVGGSFQLSGLVPGVPLSGNKNADVVLVMPAFQVLDLFSFRMDMVISSQKDPMTVIGQNTSVPSNVVFPHQNQTYGFIPVTLDKQGYRTFFHTQGMKKVYAMHASFPFTQTIDKMRAGKQFTEIINDFQMISGGVLDVNITGASQSANLNATQIAFNSAMTIVNNAAASDETMTGISLAEVQPGYLVPTDVKSLTPGGQNSLRAAAGQKMKVLTVVKRTSEMSGGAGADRLSATLVPFTNGVSSAALPLMDNPRVMSVNTVQIQKMMPSRGVIPIATYAALSVITDVRTPIWEVYGQEWVESIEIPAWPGESAPSAPAQGKLRWSVSLAANAATRSDLDLGPVLIQNITHVTNSSTDF